MIPPRPSGIEKLKFYINYHWKVIDKAINTNLNELNIRDGTNERYVFYVICVLLPIFFIYKCCCAGEEDEKTKED